PFFGYLKPQYIDWQNVSLIPGDMAGLKLKTSYEKLERLHPADIANLIENLGVKESSHLVESINKETAAEVLGEVQPQYKGTLLQRMNPKDLAKILEEMPTDEAADVLQKLSDHKRLQVMRRLKEETASTLNQLTKYEEGFAGALMTTDYMSVSPDATVAQAIEEIRVKSGQHASIYHAYVVSPAGVLKGILSIRTILLADPHTHIKTIMTPVIKTVRPNTKARDVAKLMTKYNLLSAAVTDSHRKIHGIVTVDDILRYLIPSA
ncbi:MAG: CBS domain-containing protein, partial [Candidatus Peregrinibacteria bacterium]